MGKSTVNFGGNWSNGVNAGSRYSNWNNSPTNSNNNIGSRGVVTALFPTLCNCYGIASRSLCMWSAIVSCFGKYLSRFRMPLVISLEQGY